MRKRLALSPAFTIVEIMVAMAVLSVLIVFMAQMSNSATSTITTSRKHMDADGQARLIFDQLGQDLAKMPLRYDIDYHFKKRGDSSNSGSDEMAFYSGTAGYYLGSPEAQVDTIPTTYQRNPLSLIGYRLVSDLYAGKPRCQLQRLAKGLGWEPNQKKWQDMAYLPVTLVAGSQARWPDLFATVTPDPHFQTLGTQVLRFEYTYLLRDGTFSIKPVLNVPGLKNSLDQGAAPTSADGLVGGYGKGSRWYNTSEGKAYICSDPTDNAAVWGSLSCKDISGIVVAIAVLDSSSRQIVSDYDRVSKTFPDAPMSGDIAPVWGAVLKNSQFAEKSGLPVSTASAVRVYQRTFYFPELPRLP